MQKIARQAPDVAHASESPRPQDAVFFSRSRVMHDLLIRFIHEPGRIRPPGIKRETIRIGKLPIKHSPLHLQPPVDQALRALSRFDPLERSVSAALAGMPVRRGRTNWPLTLIRHDCIIHNE